MVKTHKLRRFKKSLVNGFFALVMAVSTATTLVTFPANAETKPTTPSEFCSTLPLKSDSEKNACIDGWKGEDCSTYKLTHDEQHVNICQQGARGRSNIHAQGGQTADDDPAEKAEEAITTPTGTSTPVDKAKYEQAVKASCVQFRQNASSIATNAAEVWCLYGGLGQDGKEGIPKDDCLTKAELRGSDYNQKACLTGSKTGYAYLAGSNGKTKQANASYSQDVATACQTFHGADNSGAASVWCLYGGLGQDGKEGIPKDDCLTKAELRGSDLNQKACMYGAKTGYETIYYTAGGTNPASNISRPATNFSNSGENDILNMLINQTASQVTNGGLPINNIPGLPGGSNSSVINNFNAADNLFGSYVNGAGKQQALRVTGNTPGGNKPVIIFLNGGGFHNDDQMGDKVGPDAIKEGYTSIVATYRLGSAGLYYQYEDALRAVRHVRNNAAMYGIDANRMVIWGDSAGGSLAMRLAASGKSGVKAAVGWSAPTNAYTIMFHSFPSFAVAVDHSTCLADPGSNIQTSSSSGGSTGGSAASQGSSIPGLGNLSSLMGAAGSASSLANGSSITNGITNAQGITSPGTLQIPGFDTSSGVSSIFGNNPVTGIPNPMQSVLGDALSSVTSSAGSGGNQLGSVLSVLSLSQQGLEQGNSAKNTIYNLIQQGGSATGMTINGVDLSNPLPGSNFSISPNILSAETFLKCIDNLDAASPALYASPLSPPTYLAGFTSDPVVPPQQAYDLRDKLRSLGIPSEALIKHSDVHSTMPDPGRNHCDYCKDFLKPTFAFINKYINPKNNAGGGAGGASTGGGTANTVDPAYKAAIQQACNGYGQINPAAGISCLYGGLGQNGTVGKPQTDCLTNAQFKNSPLNQQACQAGSAVGQGLMKR